MKILPAVPRPNFGIKISTYSIYDINQCCKGYCRQVELVVKLPVQTRRHQYPITNALLACMSIPPDLPLPMPAQGRLAGIDYGTVRIGVSTCDATQQFVSPLETYARRNPKLDADYFQRLVLSEHLVGWVVGLPIHCDGKESQKSIESREFANWLHQTTDLPYAFADERFSSREARNLLLDTGWSSGKKKKNLDRIAAYLILVHFLEGRHNATQDTHPGSLED